MKHGATIAGLALLGLATAGAAVGLATEGDDQKPAAPQADRPKSSGDAPAHGEPPLAETLDRIKTEYEAAQRSFLALFKGSFIPKENEAKAAEIRPDFAAAVRRIADASASEPGSPAVRDAMIWVIQQAGRFGDGPCGGEFAVAANWLVRHNGDDPDAVRVGLGLDNALSSNRDSLLLNFYAAAKGRESKGLARLALAQYLARKAPRAEWARKVTGRPVITHDDLIGEDGKPSVVKQDQPDDEYAYVLHLQQCDVSYLRHESERLFREVIDEYGDVPFATSKDRMLEALLKQPDPQWNGQPLTAEARLRITERLARRRTLGQVAEARLDDLHNLAVGKPAPAISGLDVFGKPLALSSYRGKVVALVFWGTWCGPCVREIPREKALVERMKGRPFAMLGVDTDADPEVARKLMEAQGVAWPNWHDGAAGEGPIAQLYHVSGYPTVFLLDAEGNIRSKKAHGDQLDELVETLVRECEEAAGKK